MYSNLRILMKPSIVLGFIAFWSCLFPLQAQERDSSICVTSSHLYISGDQLIVSMQLQVDRTLRANEAVRLSPKLADSLDNFIQLPSIFINGRNQHYVFRREQAKEEKDYVELRRRNKELQTVQYLRAVRFSEWMRFARLEVEEVRCGCGVPFRTDSLLLGYVEIPPQPVPVERLLQPEEPVVVLPKNIIEKSGTAYLDFPLNETAIYPQFSANTQELEKIHRSIAQVTDDARFVLSSIELHGYASPEGPYANNERLSKERTESLKRYLMEKYALPDSLVIVRHTPEDWEGLKRLVQISDLDAKPELLEVMDEELPADKKERKLRKKYPKVFARLLQEMLPALRRTDYPIRYSILPE